MSDRYAETLEVSCRLIANLGLRDLSLASVAHEMGMTEADLVRDFPTRTELVKASLDFADGRASAYVFDQIKDESSLHRLTHLLSLYIDDAPEIREDWMLWNEMEAQAAFDPTIRPLVLEQIAWWLEMVSALIERGRSEGDIPADIDAERTAFRLVLVQDSLAKHAILGTITVEEARREMCHAVESELGVPVPAS